MGAIMWPFQHIFLVFLTWFKVKLGLSWICLLVFQLNYFWHYHFNYADIWCCATLWKEKLQLTRSTIIEQVGEKNKIREKRTKSIWQIVSSFFEISKSMTFVSIQQQSIKVFKVGNLTTLWSQKLHATICQSVAVSRILILITWFK